MWIRRTDDDHLINIKDCTDIKKGINYKYDKVEIKNYYLYFEWTKGGFKITFETEEKRDNFYEHLIDHMSIVDIDPNVEPLKL